MEGKLIKNNDLFDLMEAATDEISREYKRIRKRVKEDPGTAGDQGEENWKKVLEDWLPASYHVVTKGRILFPSGKSSDQVDVLILSPSYPKRLLNIKHYIAGGVIAAFECKTTLKKIHIKEALETCADIKNKTPFGEGTPFKELNSSVLFGLLAHSCSWSPKTATDQIDEHLLVYDKQFVNHPSETLDLLCVADLACWSSMKSTWQASLEPNDDSRSVSTAYICCCKEASGSNFTAVGTMITDLLCKIAWREHSLRPIADHFMSSHISGSGQGQSRQWENSIYSEEVLHRLVKEGLSDEEDENLWNEWSSVFI